MIQEQLVLAREQAAATPSITLRPHGERREVRGTAHRSPGLMRSAVARSEVDESVATRRQIATALVDPRLQPLTCLEGVVFQVPSEEKDLLRGTTSKDDPHISVAGQQHEDSYAHCSSVRLTILAFSGGRAREHSDQRGRPTETAGWTAPRLTDVHPAHTHIRRQRRHRMPRPSDLLFRTLWRQSQRPRNPHHVSQRRRRCRVSRALP